MIRRPTVALFLAVLIFGALTITAFAVSMPSASAPKAADLPRIVTDKPVGADTSASVITTGVLNATATPKPAKPAATATNTSGANRPGPKASASNSNDPDDDDDDDTSEDGDTDHDRGNHEVVKPRLHESDEDGHKKD